MEIRPYFVMISGCFMLGPSICWDLGEIRFGIDLIFFEIGLQFSWMTTLSYGCAGCDAIGTGVNGELPEGWKKGYRKDETYFFLCPECKKEVKI